MPRRRRHPIAGLGKSIKLDLKGEGFIHIDGAAVTNDDKPADLMVTVALKDLKALGKGELDPDPRDDDRTAASFPTWRSP